MTVTISADEPRTIRAIELAANADRWLAGTNADGDAVYGVPSQSETGRYYIVTGSSCNCPDFRNGEGHHACKHILAVRLYSELVRAQRQLARRPTERRRSHPTVVSPTDRGDLDA